ncbi:serine hydrolase domain-containing protein [Streptomyces sp. NPDC001220]
MLSKEAEHRLTAAGEALVSSAKAEKVPGASCAALVEGHWQISHYGVDDRQTARPRDETSRQHGTCLNKVLIAYVALMLVDRGLVTLDEPLNTLLPEAVRRRGDKHVDITLRQLLSHSSGIDESFEEWAPERAMDEARRARRFEQYSQIAEPGEVFVYSDAGTAIAALLIERLLDVPWRDAVNTMLLHPLGIKDIPDGSNPAYYNGAVATGHTWDEASQTFEPAPSNLGPAMADTLAERSTCFTIEEIAVLAEFALADGVTRQGERLLSLELAREMHTPQIDVPGHHLIHAWGLGWMFFDEETFGFESAGEGHENFVQIFPKQRQALVVMANAYPALVLYYDVVRALQDASWKDREIQRVEPKLCIGTYVSDGYKLVVAQGTKNLRYEFFERGADDNWQHAETGDLIPSGTGGFAARMGKRMRRGSVTPIWTGTEPEPKFFRFGQRVVRRV